MIESSLSCELDDSDDARSKEKRPRSQDRSRRPSKQFQELVLTENDGSRNDMTQDDFNRDIRKRSNTIASISDDGNQDKYKKEMNEKIQAN